MGKESESQPKDKPQNTPPDKPVPPPKPEPPPLKLIKEGEVKPENKKG
mgnify:CR=1 FL=1